MRLKTVKRAGMGRFFAMAKQIPDCVNLSLGEPDFQVPIDALKSGFKAAAAGGTRYEQANGMLALREALAAKMMHEQRLDYNPESEVLITTGGTEAIALALLALVNPGDEVLIPDPGFVTYDPCVAIAEGKAVGVPLLQENSFIPVASDVTSLITNKSRVMLLNFPNNPTGSVLSHENGEELSKIACERDLLVISDEVYEKIVYDGEKHDCLASFPGMQERTLVIGSFSKTHAMTGLRVGYVFGPKDVIASLSKLHQYLVACVDSLAQQIALAALLSSQEHVNNMVKEFGRRRDLVFKRLNEIDGITCVKPRGAFYAFPRILSFKMSSEQLSEHLLRHVQVIAVPGSLFGDLGEGHIRLAFTVGCSKLEEAFDRVEKTVRKLQAES